MKNIKIYFVVTMLILSVMPFSIKAAKTTAPITSTNISESTKAENLLNRLKEINELDKSTMTYSEKRQLNKEVRTIKKELRNTGGGVYLSVGAVIIIILLLILLV